MQDERLQCNYEPEEHCKSTKKVYCYKEEVRVGGVRGGGQEEQQEQVEPAE